MMHRAFPNTAAALLLTTAACSLDLDLGDLLDTAGDASTSDAGATTEADDAAGTSADAATSGTMGEETTGVPWAKELDVLFVIDNSGSMGEEQANLANRIDAFVAALDQQGYDWRIGITTTDNGNVWCAGTTPEAGSLVLSSCRSRLDDFTFFGTQEPLDKQEACLDVCAHDSLDIVPTAIEGSADVAPRPWIEPGNIAGGDVVGALRCALPQGINGCGFEAPLEAMSKALLRSGSPSESSFGFIRPFASLAVVFVTDEVDCSSNPEFDSIFSPEGSKSFWQDPAATAPTSAVCWNAGVHCLGGPGIYETCTAADKAESGGDASEPDNAVLFALTKYREQLQTLRLQKQVVGADVRIFAITGVPAEFPQTGIAVYADGPDPEVVANFGIGHGCSSETGFALPPVRIRELASDYSGTAVIPGLFSICEADWGPTFEAIASRIAD